MKTTTTASLAVLTITLASLGSSACSGDPAPAPATGGSSTSGGAASGGATSGGAPTSGGATSGGAPSSGGAATGGAAGGGAGGGTGGGAPAGTFTQVAAILNLNCGLACHMPGTEQVNLSSSDPAGLYMRLTTPLTTDICNGVTMAVAATPLTSLLTRVIKAPVNDAGCVLPRMPNGCTTAANNCLKDADIATIQSWIAAGAKM
jgi:hypothetical protein